MDIKTNGYSKLGFFQEGAMTSQERTSRVLVSLVASMTISAMVLMALESDSLSGGAFSLASYTSLNSPEQVVYGGVLLERGKWSSISVYYGDGSTEQLAALIGLKSGQEVSSHFVVYNQERGEDGFIQSTKKWRTQESCVWGDDWYTGNTIRICVILDSKTGRCSDCQLKRTAALIETLTRTFNVPADRISYPINWQM